MPDAAPAAPPDAAPAAPPDAAAPPEPGDPAFIGPVRLVFWEEDAFSYPYLRVPVPYGLFVCLPPHPAYKWEYYGGRGVLTPRPKLMNAVRPTVGIEPPPDLRDPQTCHDRSPVLRPLIDADWDRLPPVMGAAFHRVVPFVQMDRGQRDRAVRQCLARTRDGRDGPLIAGACFVAEDPGPNAAGTDAAGTDAAGTDAAGTNTGGTSEDGASEDGTKEPGGPALIGAVLVTLYAPGDPADVRGSHRPAKSPPADWRDTAWGAPHLTWAFVGPWDARQGVGTALLRAACDALAALGHRELTSTFLMGNDASAFWHWRNGFRLLSGPFSQRAWRHAWRERDAGAGDPT